MGHPIADLGTTITAIQGRRANSYWLLCDGWSRVRASTRLFCVLFFEIFLQWSESKKRTNTMKTAEGAGATTFQLLHFYLFTATRVSKPTFSLSLPIAALLVLNAWQIVELRTIRPVLTEAVLPSNSKGN